MIPVKGCVKNYHWGKRGEDSYIAKFQAQAPRTPTKRFSNELAAINNNNNNEINKNPPLAELWFGAHPSGPASLIVGEQFIQLDEFLARQPEMVGVVEHYYKYQKQLPFLFKLLAVAQPLSLQAHPDKKLAQVLHANDPKNYPDANHKPELAIALTEFQVLCDFRPVAEIVQFLAEMAPFRRIVGDNNYTKLASIAKQSHSNDTELRLTLGECFKSLMFTQKEVIMKETKELLSLLSSGKYLHLIGRELTGVISELESLYPGDQGIFAPLFLNYLKLTPGQAIYLEANKLHAYLKGECIECMACSDNVVRAGLTTKFRDVKTLTEMLDYKPVKSSSDLILTPSNTLTKQQQQQQQQENCSITLFAPTEEFKVEKIVISNSPTSDHFTLPSVKSGSFLIVLPNNSGKATTMDFFDLKTKHKLRSGFSGFIPPKIQLKLSDIQGTLVMYRAFC